MSSVTAIRAGSEVTRQFNGSIQVGIVMQSENPRTGYVDVLWENAAAVSEVKLSELSPRDPNIQPTRRELTPNSISSGKSKSSYKEMSREKLIEKIQMLTKRAVKASKDSGIEDSHLRKLEEGSQTAIESMNKDEMIECLGMLNQLLAATGEGDIEINEEIPPESVLRYYGHKSADGKLTRGDIVERSARWPYGNQDGGAGNKGLITSVDEDDYCHVVWRNGNANRYGEHHLKYVARVRDIRIGDTVERGPDWKYGDQDGGPGKRGQVVEFTKNGLEVWVVWERGAKANYLWGAHDYLKVVKSAVPVKDTINSLLATQNNNSTQLLCEGDFVIRGKDWKEEFGDEDGGSGKFGRVVMAFNTCSSSKSSTNEYTTFQVKVRWEANKAVKVYSYGKGGLFEVSLVLPKCRTKDVFKHWSSRVTSVPAGCSADHFICGLCQSDSAAEINARPPFFCTKCNSAICLKCYHDRPPPLALPLVIQFCLQGAKDLFALLPTPLKLESSVEKYLVAAGGDVTKAIEKYQSNLTQGIRLFNAAQKEDLEMIKQLLKEGMDPNIPGPQKRTALHIASLKANYDIVEYLVNEGGADIYVLDEDEDEPLAFASQGGSKPIVDFLLSKGSDPNKGSKNLITPLMRAIINGHKHLIETYMTAGAIVTTQDKNLNTALHHAAEDGMPECIPDLILAGAELDVKNIRNFTPLHEAARKNRVQCIEVLIASGASLYIEDEDGSLPIHIAAAFNSTDAIKCLLDADKTLIDKVTFKVDTPLHIACKITRTSKDDDTNTRGEEAAIELILRGANLFAVDKGNVTPLHMAAATMMPVTTKMMVDRMGGNLETKDSDGDTALANAVGKSSLEISQILLDAGADVNCICRKDSSLLELASLRGAVDIVRLLLKYDINMIHVDKDGDDCFQHALGQAEPHDEVIRALLEKGKGDAFIPNKRKRTTLHRGASKGFNVALRMILEHPDTTVEKINMQDYAGDTALHDAIENGFEDTARMLIEFGSRTDIKNKNGQTAYDLARKKSTSFKSLLDRASIIYKQAQDEKARLIEEHRKRELERQQFEESDLVRHVRMSLGDGDHVDLFELKLYENFKSLDEMKAYMMSLTESNRTEFCKEFMGLLGISNIRNRLQLSNFLNTLVNGLVNEPAEKAPSTLDLRNLSAQSSLTPPSTHTGSECPNIEWKSLLLPTEKTPLIGRGSFGIVFKAKYKINKQTVDVAVKLVPATTNTYKVCEDNEYQKVYEKTWTEANAIFHAFKNIPNPEYIIKILGVVEGELPLPWFEMLRKEVPLRAGARAVGIVIRYIPGGTLSEALYPSVPSQSTYVLDLKERIRILQDIAYGILQLHSLTPKYIIHGDIKPANILINNEVSPPFMILSDFGMSEFKEEIMMNSMRMSSLAQTTTFNPKGTPIYNAPELSRNPYQRGGSAAMVSKVSRSTDMYSFAVLAWEVLTGEKAFADVKDADELRFDLYDGKRPPLDKLPLGIPPGVEDMLTACWDGDRSKRLTASEAYATLRHAYTTLSSDSFDIFLSHPWSTKPFLSHVFNYLTRMGYRVWYDQFNMGHDLRKSMEQGIARSHLMLVCVNKTYQERPNCMFELETAAQKYPDKKRITLVLEPDVFSWANESLSGLCELQIKRWFDLSKAIEAGDWESQDVPPTEEMQQKLTDLLKPLILTLRSEEFRCPRSLLAQSNSVDARHSLIPSEMSDSQSTDDL